jgi:hypothetical protein
MSTFELAGEAMLQVHEGNRGFALALSKLFRGLFTASTGVSAPVLLGSVTFHQQEPDLAKETHLPGTYIGSF